MIIGNNNNNKNNGNIFNKSINEQNQFNNRLNTLKKDTENFKTNIFSDDIKTINHSNPVNKKDIQKKSLAMLQERLNNGLITLEEFNKKCLEISKNNKQK